LKKGWKGGGSEKKKEEEEVEDITIV